MQTRLGPLAVEVALEYSEHGDEVVLAVRSADGSKLTPQQISDAVMETLMYEHGMTRLSDRPLDS